MTTVKRPRRLSLISVFLRSQGEGEDPGKCMVVDDNRGVALIATLILGMIAISFTLTMIYLSREGSRMSGIEGRYQEALQAANGGAELAIDFIRHYTGSASRPAIYDSATVVDGVSWSNHYPDTNTGFTATLGTYRVTVTIVNTEHTIESGTLKCLHHVVSQAVNTGNSNERATVDVLYKVSYE